MFTVIDDDGNDIGPDFISIADARSWINTLIIWNEKTDKPAKSSDEDDDEYNDDAEGDDEDAEGGELVEK